VSLTTTKIRGSERREKGERKRERVTSETVLIWSISNSRTVSRRRRGKREKAQVD